MHDYINI